MSSQQMSLKDTQQLKLKEVELHKSKLLDLQSDLEKLNEKINNKDEQLSIDDAKFIAELGWLTALSVSVVAAAAVL